MLAYQILGFAPSGEPILPNTSTSADSDVVRRDKLGWETISTHAAKIVSFIGSSTVASYLPPDAYQNVQTSLGTNDI
jgi:hypothetical protein